MLSEYAPRRLQKKRRNQIKPMASNESDLTTSSTSSNDSGEIIQFLDCMTQTSTAGLRGKRQIIKYLCSRFEVALRDTKSKKLASSKHSLSQGKRLSPEDIKIKWRRDQICSQIKQASVVNSSWRIGQPQVIWCGYIRKGKPMPWRQPQERWFEVRKEPTLQGSAAAHIVVMQYQSASTQTVKRLVVSDPRREAARDIISKAYISVAVEGRKGRVMLSLAWDHEADALVFRIAAALRPALSFLK